MDFFTQNKTIIIKKYISYFFVIIVSTASCLDAYGVERYSNSGYLEKQIIDKKITITAKNRSLTEILVDICKKGNIKYGIKDDVVIDNNIKYSISVNNITIKATLTELLKYTNFDFELDGDVVYIIYRKAASKAEKVEVKISGKVLELGGKTTIPGATILVTGTSDGAITNMEGDFILTAKIGDQLEISYVGKKTKYITIYKGITNFTVELENDITVVEDVYVTGYGNIKRHEMVGAVDKISGDDLNKTANQSLTQMLQGKVAGLVVTNNSGMVGTRQKVKIRGTSTLLGNQDPVWVVDGMIQEDPIPFKTSEFNTYGAIDENNIDAIRNFVGNAISWLNPNDIDNITVLKDASATAIYGVKAANGVIVITTKRGTEGKVSISYSGNFSANQKSNYEKLNMMNSQERVDVSREIIQNGYISSSDLSDIGYEGAYKDYMNREISYDEFNRLAKIAETTNTNWLDLLMRNSFSNSHSFSLSGGNDRFTYYSSLGANYNKGEAIGNDLSSYSASVKVNGWIIPNKLSIDTRLSANISNTTGLLVSPYEYALRTSREIPAYVDGGTPYFYPYSGQSSGLMYNFENERDNSSNKNRQTQINGSTALRWKIFQNLELEANLGYATSNSQGTSYLTERSYAMSVKRGYEFGTKIPADFEYKESKLPHGGEYNYTESTNFSYTARTQMNYNEVFAGDHRLNATLGFELRSSKYNGYDEVMYGYIPDRGHTFSLPPLTVLKGNGEYVENSIYNSIQNDVTDKIVNYMSAYFMAGYSYKERYTISGSIRNDASNRFGQNTNAKFLPVFAFGGRWNVAEENWMKNQNVVNNLSLRASYGWQGNVAENFGPDLIASVIGMNDVLTGENILKIKSLPYEDLRWEKVKTYNFGADFGLFSNKLQVAFNYYNKRTDDMIVYLNVPMSFGIHSMPINGGSMNNSGYDLTLTATPVRTENFSWSLSVNTSKNINKIVSTLEEKKDWRTAVGGDLSKDNFAYSSIWGFKYLGLDPNNGAPLHYIPEVGDPGFNPNDATTFMGYLGTLEPDFTGGISTNFRYKNFSLSASFNLNIGSVRFLSNYVNNWTSLPQASDNMSKEFVDRWRKPGDESRYGVKPAIPTKDNIDHLTIVDGSTAYNYDMYNNSDNRIVNGNFLRCNNISFNYTVPAKILKKMGIENLSVNAGMSNPFTIVSKDFKGIDPEVATGSSPLLKSFNFGINITL